MTSSADLDVCPVCGFVKRARGAEPGLCPAANTHPGASESVPERGTQKITTSGRARTRLVRVHARWEMPA